LAEGWTLTTRYFFGGEIEGVVYDIALTFRRLQTMGEPRLVCGGTIAIQRANEEHVLASTQFETFTSGPKVARVRQALMDFVESKETQYRAIEKLKELSDAS
jgi:hypothetical protein